MKEIGTKELRELQMCVLDEIDRFCREHHIYYTMSGGTLLGAVRHKGFIPWDDDMDIQMLRKDYLRFIQLWNNSVHNSYYELISIESGNNRGYAFAKMIDNRTASLVKGMESEGVYVDIFPLDKVKDYDDFTRRRQKHIRLFRQRKGLYWRRLAKSGQIPFWRIVLAHLRSPHFPSKTLEQVVEEINMNAQELENESCTYYFEMVSGFRCKDLIPASVFNTYIELPFENRRYMCVEAYDEYLTRTFGNYMQLPPKEEQVKQHMFSNVYWKNDVTIPRTEGFSSSMQNQINV